MSRLMLGGVTVLLLTVAGYWHAVAAQDAPPPPPPPRSEGHHSQANAATRPAFTTPTTRPLSALAPGEERVAVRFDAGHDTDPRDRGRPVKLIAAALNVPEDVFRETFTHVHPAGPGSGGPTDAEARQNKAALMKGLSPYGVTDQRLNQVSNFYRYMKRNGDDLWQHHDATAFAVVRGSEIVRFDLVDPGFGYTTPPAATIEGMPEAKVVVKLVFGPEFTANGSIQSMSMFEATTEKSP